MKTVLITGASRGIGYATTTHFLKKGWHVIACSRNILPLQNLVSEHRAAIRAIELDLSNQQSIEDAVDSVLKNKERIDVLIHNSGHLVNKPFADITLKDLVSSYGVNVIGPFQLTQKLFPMLNENSHTVFISSMGGFQGSVKFPGLTAYSSSKAAAASLAECLQAEFADYSHSFNCLCLGAVQTEMLNEAFPGYEAPLQPKHMAAFIHQFATTASQFMRGKVIPVSLSTP
jgi:NAD(P)-dependent dehydrogenase (short-subunit alcohol dehydrogenase family)